ncbi:hypothetical protein EV648_109235 [Kribbella sp. VKM Ac-2568]|nr:hypothetical protein EV648_109235 [Kribbella sp. VKM Ac-2568]
MVGTGCQWFPRADLGGNRSGGGASYGIMRLGET